MIDLILNTDIKKIRHIMLQTHNTYSIMTIGNDEDLLSRSILVTIRLKYVGFQLYKRETRDHYYFDKERQRIICKSIFCDDTYQLIENDYDYLLNFSDELEKVVICM